jgi:outer membrane protein assembly factor BamD
MFRFIFICSLFVFLSACSKEEPLYKPSVKSDPYLLYKEGYEALTKNDYFAASKKFAEAELNFNKIELAAKSAMMTSYSLYGINFYDEAVDNLERFIKTYPANKNIMYAHYLLAIIYYEQISDEQKDLKPLLNAKEKINFFIKNYPDTDYAIDLKFKNDLIQNQLAAKELYIARYYITVKKWVPAINRLKIIVEKFDETAFIEEALYRLVEINYHIGLEEEAKKYAAVLGYNYNSSEWFKQSYKILNKNYKFVEKKEQKNNDNFLKKIIKKIK